MRKLFLLSGAIVLLDQVTKLAVKGFNVAGFEHEGMQIGQRIPLLGDLLRLNYVENAGMAFGLSLGVPFLLGLFSIGAAIFLVYLIRRDRHYGMTPFHYSLAVTQTDDNLHLSVNNGLTQPHCRPDQSALSAKYQSVLPASHYRVESALPPAGYDTAIPKA